MKIEIRNLDSFLILCISEGYCTAQKCCHSLFLQLWIYQFLMSFRSITYANDVLDELNIKMTVSKSGTTRKILQYLAEPSKVLQKCCSCRFLWNWANTVNLCAALKTESLFSLVRMKDRKFSFFYLGTLECIVTIHGKFIFDIHQISMLWIHSIYVVTLEISTL